MRLEVSCYLRSISEAGKAFLANRDLLLTYVAQLVTILGGFGFVVLASSWGGVTTYGAFAVLSALGALVTNLITFRTNEALIYFYRRAQLNGERSAMKFSIVAGMLIDTVVAAAAVVVMFLLSGFVASGLLKGQGGSESVLMYSAYVAAVLLRGSPIALLQAELRFRTVNILSSSEPLIRVLVLVLFKLFNVAISLETLVCCAVVGAVSSSLFGYLTMLRSLRASYGDVKLSWDRGLVRQYTVFSGNTFLSSLLKAGNQQVDTLLLGAATGPAVVGMYALVRQFMAPLGFLSLPFSSLMYPRFVSDVADNKLADIGGSIRRTNRVLACVFVFFAPALLLACVLFLTRAQQASERLDYLPLILISLSAALSAMLWWARPFSNAVDPRFSLVANAVATAYSLVLLYPAALWFGMLGVAAVVLTQTLLLSLYWNGVLRRHV